MRRSREPFLWAMFGGGGMLAALFLPALFFLLVLRAQLGWGDSPGYSALIELWRSPLVRGFLLLTITLSLFHWAHRFRYTLYDGLQLYHLNQLIAVMTYGVATLLSGFAAYTLLAVL
jgi:fumarate reductase subunit D